MSSGSTVESRLKKLAKQIPDERNAFNMLRSLEGASTHTADRAAAIVGATLLENALEAVILSRLSPFLSNDDRKDLFDGDKNAPISTFSSKIKMAHAMSVFGRETRKQLDAIRVVRNAFAHSSRNLTFETKEVSDLVSRLTAYKGKSLTSGAAIKTSKERFITNVAYLQARLKQEIHRHSPMASVLRHQLGKNSLP